MNRRFSRLAPIGAALVALGALAGVLAFSGCTVYREPEYQTSYDDEAAYADTVADEEYADFSDLDFWGQWFELYPYGTVWRPTVVMDWQPYTNGQWMWSTYGWTWVSYEPFGWATYHYGWWVRDYAWGWVWVPDYEWHPSTVAWIQYDDYIGWAPLPPPGVDPGYPWGPDPCDCWIVVQADHFTDNDVIRRKVRYKSPKVRSSVIYHEPDLSLVEVRTHRSFKPIDIKLVPVSKSATVDRMQLPSEQEKFVSRYREHTERELRDAAREIESTKRREVTPVTREERPRDNPSTSNDNGGSEQTVREPPARKDEAKKEPVRKEPTRVGRPHTPTKAQPKKEPQKEPEKKPETKPRKEEPRKEKPKKEEPKKDDSGKGEGKKAPTTRPYKR